MGVGDADDVLRRSEARSQALERLLALAREYVGMDLAWISRFTNGVQHLEVVDDASGQFGVDTGFESSLQGSYCRHVIDGVLANVVPDSRTNPITRELEVTDELGIGSYLGVPVRDSRGAVRGMLCCVSREARSDLDARDVRFLGFVADLVSGEIEVADHARASLDARHEQVTQLLEDDDFEVHYQPIIDLGTGEMVGAEALARFQSTRLATAEVFADAAAVGLGTELELRAAERALEGVSLVDAPLYVAFNVSPATATSAELAGLLGRFDASRVVVEITEHAQVDTAIMRLAARNIRGAGARVAVDDAGAGYSGLHQILEIRPDLIKLDSTLIRGIDADPARRALARALAMFTRYVGATLIAEGVETQRELDAVLAIGVDAAQGYLIAKPSPLPLPEVIVAATPRAADRDLVAGLDGFPIWDLATSSSFDHAARAAVEATLIVTGLEIAYLTLYREGDPPELEHRYVTATSDLTLPEGFTIPWDESLCARCRAEGLRWTASVPTDLPGVAAADALGITTFVSIPLTRLDDSLIGTLCAAGREPRYLDKTVLAALENAAVILADRFQREAVSRTG